MCGCFAHEAWRSMVCMLSGFSYLRASCCSRSRRRGLRRAYGSGMAAVCRNIGAGRYPRLPTVRRRKNIIYMGMEKKRLPKTCPACGSVLRVRSMYCHSCDTQIEGDYPLPPLSRLSDEEQRFVMDFVICSGSLKEMASRMGLSYPSVRNRLDEIIGELRRVMPPETKP